MLVTANDSRLKYQNQLSSLASAQLRTDQAKDNSDAMTKQQFQETQSMYQPVPTSAVSVSASSQSTGKSVASEADGKNGYYDFVQGLNDQAGIDKWVWVDTGPTAEESAHTAFTTTNPGMIDPNYGTASDRLAAVSKGEYEDKKARFDPLENQLMSETTYANSNLAGQEIGKAEADTMASYDNTASSSAIQLGRYGMGLTSDQQTSNDRLTGLGKSGAVVDAANNIRLKLVERNQTIAAGTSSTGLTGTTSTTT